MLHTLIHANSYQDSINLMLLTTAISQQPDVDKVQIMMGTQANKDIFETAGLLTEEAKKANPNDMVIVMEVKDASTVDVVLKQIDDFLNDLSVKKSKSQTTEVTSWQQALEAMPEANIALFSIPGTYAAEEIENALDNNLHAFVFSDNVSKEDEIRLKQKAHEKGLLVMGPDCGTGIINNIPLAFTNNVRSGNIGMIGASGTGIQEVTTLIDRMGAGVKHAIGTGGRDLSADVGGITMKDALVALQEQDDIDVLVIISKPPAKSVRDEMVQLLHAVSKPVVTIFIGENPAHVRVGNVYSAYTLEETARYAVDLANHQKITANYTIVPEHTVTKPLTEQKIVGLYSGGTLAYEAGMLIGDALQLPDQEHQAGYILKSQGFDIIDLGDDIYTQGRPHPMIDPHIRVEKIQEYAKSAEYGVILLDVVLGYGAHPDMAGALAPAIEAALRQAREAKRELQFIVTVVGTDKDTQSYQRSVDTLTKAGALVEASNAKAVTLALAYLGKKPIQSPKDEMEFEGKTEKLPEASPSILSLLTTPPKVLNIGLSSFVDSIRQNGATALQFNWQPPAGGDIKLIRLIRNIRAMEAVQKSNEAVVQRLKDSAPFLLDVVPAKSVIDVLNQKTLLHAGPPIAYADMTGPMQGSCVGAVLFEGWASDEKSARALLENGEINFLPCHHVKAVGPMGGITSGNMPVLVVSNQSGNNQAYCTMNEGIGKVLRFGAFSSEVIERLKWMKDTLAPTLSKALKALPDGLNLNTIIAKAITMGDEFHQRNIAASLLFLKEITPLILPLEIDQTTKETVIQFLADTDQFFLNIMMATGKSMVDYARQIEEGCIVTTMTRNGKNFGIRISGMGDEWFTAPVNTPQGLFFTGFSQEDANPDIGDSAITETVGVGAMSMIAAPGVTRFVGAGGFEDALKVSNEMAEITLTHNANFSIPTWDFKGAPLGIDILKVVETGITPLINTGIAHKQAGVGQVGAGTVRAPLACFSKALIAYGKKLGLTE